MTEDQYLLIYTTFSDLIQLGCDYLLNSDFLINFPDWNGSWLFINEGVLKTCENLGYISEHCGYDIN